MCRTAPNAIRSLTGGARLPRAAKPSPRNDASATALRGALDASVRILLSIISNVGGDRIVMARDDDDKDAHTRTHAAYHTHTHTHTHSKRKRDSESEIVSE